MQVASRCRIGAVVVAVLVTVTACTTGKSTVHSGISTREPPPVGTVGPAGAHCPSSTPVAPARIPSAVAGRPDAGALWYGTADLWADAWFAAPGIHIQSGGSDGAIRVKWGTFTLHDGALSPFGGPPHVTARRLDGPAATVAAAIDPSNYATTGTAAGSWWPTVIDFPAAGCWDITETRGPTTVRFTVPVLA